MKLGRLRFLCAILAVYGMAVSGVQANPAMSLSQAVARALEHDPVLTASRLDRDAMSARVEAAKGAFFPSLVSSNRAGLRHLETAAGRENLITSRYALSLRQPIYASGALTSALEAAESRKNVSEAALALEQQRTILSTVETFIAVLQDQASLDLAIAAEQRLAVHVETMRQRYRFGAVTAGDVARAEARQAQAAASRGLAARALKVSGAHFRRFVGEPPGALSVPPQLTGLPDSLEQALESLARHPLLRQASHLTAAANAEQKVAEAALGPRLSFEGDAVLADQPEASTSGRQDASIALNLVVPIYQGGVAASQAREAHLIARKQASMENAERLRLETEIVSSWENLKSGSERRSSLSRRVAAAELTRDSYEEEARLGERPIIDLIDAETELLEARHQAAYAQLEQIADGYRLLAALGRIDQAF